MGDYDDLLAQIPKANNQQSGGDYDDLLAKIPKTKPQEIVKPKEKDIIGDVFGRADTPVDKIIQSEINRLNSKSVMYGLDGAAPVRTATPKDQQLVKDVFAENFAKNNVLKQAPEVSDSILRVGARQGVAGIGKAEAGLVKLAADLVGSDTLGGIADAVRQSADDYEKGVVLRNKNVEGFAPDSIVQKLPNAAVGAVNSVVQMAPSLAVGGLTKVGALPALFGQTTTQEYANNREAGQSLIPALLNAGGKAGFEVAGEKLGGLDKISDAIKGATRGNGIADLGASLLTGGVKETPSELFTTTGQFAVDKLPVIGNNQDATLGDLGNQLVDTALTSMIQGGGMAAGGSVVNQLAKSPRPVEKQFNADPVVNTTVSDNQQSAPKEGLNIDGVLGALNRAKELVESKRVAQQETNQMEAINNVTLQPNIATMGAGANEQGNINLQGSLGANANERTGQDEQQGMGNAAAPLGGTSNDAGLVRNENANPNDTVAPAPSFEERMVKHGDMLKSWLPDFGWNTEGGKIIRDPETGEVTGRTVWTPKNEYLDYVRESLGRSYTVIQASVQKALDGKPLGKRQLEDVNAVMDLFDELTAQNSDIVTGDPAQDDLYNQLANDEAWSTFLESTASTDEILSDIAQHYQIELDANKEAGSLDYGFNPETEGTVRQGGTGTPGNVLTGIEKTVQPSAASQGQITETSEQTSIDRENVATQTNQAARSAVEAIAKRRAAANQINKSKQFDTALQLAKDFLNGEQVSPVKFANAAKMFANDTQLSEAFKQLHTIAKAPAKQARSEATNMVEGYKKLITGAKSLRELQQIGRDIQDEKILNDAQIEALDDFFMEAQDKFEVQEDEQANDTALELTGETNNEILAKEKAAEETRKQEAEAAKKAEADAKVNDFTLTGSNREADVAASKGAQDLFSQPNKSEKPAEPTSKIQDNLEENTSQSISDFGEKLEGAKKDLWKSYKKAMSDELPADAKDITLAKHFPEPDYENLIASGMDIKAIGAIKAMRDMLPSKPKMAGKLRRWGAEIAVVRSLSNMLIEQKLTIEELSDRLAKNQLLYKFQETIELYAELGYPAMKSAKGYRVSGGWTSYTNGIVDKGQQFALESPNSSREYFSDRESAIARLRSKLEVAPEKTDRKTKLDIYRITKTGDIVIGKKVASNKFIDLKTGFKTAREARQYYSENEVELLKLLQQKKDVRPERRSANDPRVGDDYRQGIDVTQEKFSAEFGFRGVQFGNYVENERRVKDLNNAYDALLDLANIINVPPRAISLNGSLGLAFGARGSGGKNAPMAHYEASNIVINLTKVNGAGSLGHEWFHAMDNYFSRMRDQPNDFVTSHPTAKMKYSGGIFVEDQSIRPELLKAFEDVMRTIRSSGILDRSRELDKTRSKDYWSTNLEMAARAFEAYLISKAKDKGYSNDYLANIADQETYGDDVTYPYPTQSEQEIINEKFDALFATLKNKEGENGNVILFSQNKNNGSYGLTKAQVEEAVKNDLYGMDIDVYQTFNDVPDYVKEQANSEAGGYVEGYYDPKSNRVALIASNLSSTYRAVEVVRHELIGHYGMENMLGKELMLDLVNEVLDAEEAGNKTIIELAKQVDETQPGISDYRRAKEIIAVMAERNMQNDIVRRVMDAIRKFLKRIGLVQGNITDAEIATMLREAQDYLQGQGRSITEASESSFSRSAMKSTEANIKRGERSMNDALINKHDVNRAMYHNELGWIDFVIGDDNKGIQHIAKGRMERDGLTSDEVYSLLTKDLIETIATGNVIRKDETTRSLRIVIKGTGNEAVLVKSTGSNGWLLTGFEVNEQVNQSRSATTSDLRSTNPIRSRFGEGAALNELSNIAKGSVNDKSSFSRSTAKDNPTSNIKDADIASNLGSLKEAGDHYNKAKSGNVKAALTITSKLITPDLIKKLTDTNADYVLGVASIEQSGANAIPVTSSTVIAEKLGVKTDQNVYQSSSPKRTGMDGLDRIFNRPIFSGNVVKGAKYILVDDTITQGGTFAELNDFITENGGEVVANVALTGKAYSSKIALSDTLLNKVKSEFGDIENEFKQITGYGYQGLTESEARYIISSPRNADRFRSKISEGVSERNNQRNKTPNQGNEPVDFSRASSNNSRSTKSNFLFRRDELGRVQLAITGKAYDKVANVTQIIADKAMFGMASPELRKLIRHFKADMAKAMDMASNVAQTMAPMSTEDRAIVSDVVENMVKTGVMPPDHILKIAAGMQLTMDSQTDELVKLGMLSKESAERWRGKYLPRFYNREADPALDTFTKKMLRTALPVRGMGGGSLKGRGLYEEINVTELDQWEALGWEVRDNLWKKNQTGKLELIDPNKVRDTDKVMVWRDFTPAERESMGENRDALFRFVMGYTAMQNDIALGRMFDSIAKNQEWTRSRPSEGFTKVPDTEISDTGGVKKYGNLAGLYVRDDIIQHITQYEESGELLKFYKKALSFWKMGKTVLNPVSHMNNVVSNLTMAHFAGVSYWETHKYVGALRDFVKGSPMLDEAKDIGLMTGDITRAELLAEMPDDIKALMNMQESKITKSAKMTYNVLTFGLTKPMSKAYRFEDDFFKYLIYRDARKAGLSPDDAVDYATRYIFNYDDLPKGARVVRDSAIPFFAYTYKAVPALAHTLFNYPWRFAAPAMAIAGLNAVMFGLAAGDDDDDLQTKLAKGKALEEQERKSLPPWLQGKSALGTEKTIRLGTDEKTGLPVYMDVSRMVPGGDIFDLNNQADGVALPAPITPSNPVLTTIAAMLWNKDTFSGKEVVDINDTDKEKFKKRSGWLLKQLSPAVAPTGYHFDKLMEATAQLKGSPIETPFADYTGYGKDGLPVQAKYALPNVLGIKAKPTDLEYSASMAQGQDLKEANSIKSELRQAARLLDKKAITEREYERLVAEAEKKLEAIGDKF